jgi:hypothetical protein
MHASNGHIVNRIETISTSSPASPAPARAREAAQASLGCDLLKEIVGTSLGPLAHLGDTINLTLDQVSEWIARPENRRHIFNLLGLLDAQTQLLISQQRVMAAAQLARLAADDTAGPETVRRACKDLLSLRLVERSRPPARTARGGDDLAPLPVPKAMSYGEILGNLRRFEGRSDDRYAGHALDAGQSERAR